MSQARSGRSRERESFWRTQIQEQQSSGLSVREFCRRQQLRETSFYHWRRTLAERDGAARHEESGARPTGCRASGKSSASLVPVVVAAGPAGGMEIALPGGTTVRLNDRVDGAYLKQVLAVLREHEVESAS